MKKIGCVTPFSINKDQICTNLTKAKKALDFYDRYKYKYETVENGSCYRPCSYNGIRIMKINRNSLKKGIAHQNKFK